MKMKTGTILLISLIFSLGVVRGQEKDPDKVTQGEGTDKQLNENIEESELLKGQKKNAIKFNLLLPIAGASAFSYERSITKGKSFEVEIGIINSGKSSPEMSMEAKGMFVKAGMKFIRTPAHFYPGSHLLKGLYLKPELAISSFTFDKSKVSAQLSSGPGDISGSVAKMAVLCNGGNQMVLNDWFILDTYLGVGLLLGEKEQNLRYFAFTGNGKSPFVLSGGVKIGILL